MFLIRKICLFFTLVSIATIANAQECSVATTGLAWSIYDQLMENPTYGEGNIIVKCNSNEPYTIYMDNGQGSTSFFPRKMTGEGTTLDYYIFVDGGHSKVWGDGTKGSFVSIGVGATTFPLYGMIPPKQPVPPGNYTDSVKITVLW